MASEIRANKQTNRVGLGTVTYTDTGISVSGIVTANSFKGDGSSLTGIDATALKDTGGAVKIQAQASGLMVTGITTVSGNLMPGSDNNLNLGSLSQRWANIYVGDMNLSNKGSSNIVDGTWGNFCLLYTSDAADE